LVGRGRAIWSRWSVRCCGLARRRGDLRRGGFDLLQHQLELLDGALDALRARTELLPTQLGELGPQLLGLQRLRDQAGLGRSQLGRAGSEQHLLGTELPPELLDLSAMIAAIAHGRSVYTASALPRDTRLPGALWGAPVDALQQHRQLRRGERDRA